MLLVSDVHGAAAPLRRVLERGEVVLVLGDLINFIDYRTYEGIVTDVAGEQFVRDMVERRTAGDGAGARALWSQFADGREAELQAAFRRHIVAAYEAICPVFETGTAFVTYGNVDTPELLAQRLPSGARFVDGEVVDIDGLSVGFAGGGIVKVGSPGEVSEDEMADKLDRLGPVDVLCTHVPPAVPALASDVVGGRQKGSQAVLDYLARATPAYHYFGDVHQPQALSWTVGATTCRNVGYFRATGRAVRHG